MHRPIGGLQELRPKVYRGAAHFLLDLIRPGGLMFTQVPRRLVEVADEHRQTCESIRNRPDVLEVMTTSQRPHTTFGDIDENDLYAVILKAL